MPEPENPQPAATPEPAKKSSFSLYIVCGVAVVLAIACWNIFGKYKMTKTSLEVTTKEKTTIETQLHQVQEAYSDYKKVAESSSTYVKIPYVLNGKVVFDKKGGVVYQWKYVKLSSSSATGSSAVTTTTSASSSVTAVSDTHSKATTQIQSGVPINGVVHVGIPFSVFTGSLKSANIGFDHATGILDSWGGIEVGSSDFTDIFKNHYIFLHLGWGTR